MLVIESPRGKGARYVPNTRRELVDTEVRCSWKRGTAPFGEVRRSLEGPASVEHYRLRASMKGCVAAGAVALPFNTTSAGTTFFPYNSALSSVSGRSTPPET